MMQGAKGQAIADYIMPLWVGVRHNMSGIDKVQLNPAHCTSVCVCSQYLLPEHGLRKYSILVTRIFCRFITIGRAGDCL